MADAGVSEYELGGEMRMIAEGDPGLQPQLAERLSGLPRAQRRTLARRAAQDGVLDRLGPFGAALARA